ncbi:tyrosine-type recombinase/integrase [Paracoccus sp. Z118]|nr:tyrosine-type recombinase/integrase [Paracoccus sp. Z118]
MDIKDSYPKTSETFTLGTKDYHEALRLVRIAAVEVDERFAEHRRRTALERASVLDDLTYAQIAATKDAYYQHLLEEDEDIRLDGFVDLDDDGRVIGSLSEDPLPSFDEHGQAAEDWRQDTRHQYARGKSDVFWDGEVDEVLSWDGIGLRLSPSSPSRPRLIRALQEAVIEAIESIQRRQQGEVVPTPQGPSAPSATAPLLSVKVSEWIAEKSRHDWSKKAEDDHRQWLFVFTEITGDKPVDEYGKADGLRFKAVLKKLPPNVSKVKELRGLSIVDAATKAEALGMEAMSIPNYNKAMARVGSFFKWAVANTVEEVRNPVEGLRQKDPTRDQDKRHPVAVNHLTTLFSSPVWRSCRSERFASQPGNMVISGHWKFWLPLISLWSGARSNEIGQLLLKDIKHEDGVDYLHVIDDTEGKRVKSRAGRRKVPIHDQLMALGFMDLVNDRRRRHRPEDRLFPDLKVGAKGYYSHNVTKFFSAYMEQIGIKTEKTSFHSLRRRILDLTFRIPARPEISCLTQIGLEFRDGDYGGVSPGLRGGYPSQWAAALAG